FSILSLRQRILVKAPVWDWPSVMVFYLIMEVAWTFAPASVWARPSRLRCRLQLISTKSECGVITVNEQRDARLLIAEDEANLRLVLQKELQRLGYRVQAAPDGEAALRKLEESNVDVLLCDINMPNMDGMELLRRVHERPNPPEVIMLTGQGTIETAVEAMKLGAYDYLTKPYSINELDVRVRQACEKRNLRVDNQRLRAQIERKTPLPEIVSQSRQMAEAIR